MKNAIFTNIETKKQINSSEITMMNSPEDGYYRLEELKDIEGDAYVHTLIRVKDMEITICTGFNCTIDLEEYFDEDVFSCIEIKEYKRNAHDYFGI